MLQDALKVSLVFSSVPPILRTDMLLRFIFERYFVYVDFMAACHDSNGAEKQVIVYHVSTDLQNILTVYL